MPRREFGDNAVLSLERLLLMLYKLDMTAWLALLLAASIDTSAGDRLYEAGQFAQAEVFYRQLLQQSPRELKLLVRLGASQYQLGSFAEAEKSFRTAVSIAPNSAQAEIGWGTSLLALDRSREALPVLEKATNLAPSDRMAWRALGHAYQKEDDLFKGERVLQSLVEQDPQDAESWHYLGALLYDHNFYVRALEAFNRVLELQPADDGAEIYKAGALAQLGRTQEAGELYQSLAKRRAAAALPELWVGYAQYLFEDQQPQQSLDAINRASILLPDSPKVRFWRARVLMSLGRMDEAEKDAQKAVALSPELPNAHNLLMKIYRSRGLESAADEQARWLAGHTTGNKAGIR